MRLIHLLFLLVSLGFVNAQKDIGLDVQTFATRSLISIPDAFEPYNGEGIFSFDLGVCMFYNINDEMKMRFGVHLWNKPIITTAKISNNQLSRDFKEEAIVKYTGIYFQFNFEEETTFLGLGFDYSFKNEYEKISATLNNNPINYYGLAMTDKFNNQFDLVAQAGLKFDVSESFKLRPSIQFTIPIIDFFETNQTSVVSINGDNKARVHGFLVKFGFNTEFSL
mgnify:CR=1 FL=1